MLLVKYMLLLIVGMRFNLHKLYWAIDLIVCLKFFGFFFFFPLNAVFGDLPAVCAP